MTQFLNLPPIKLILFFLLLNTSPSYLFPSLKECTFLNSNLTTWECRQLSQSTFLYNPLSHKHRSRILYQKEWAMGRASHPRGTLKNWRDEHASKWGCPISEIAGSFTGSFLIRTRAVNKSVHKTHTRYVKSKVELVRDVRKELRAPEWSVIYLVKRS